MKVIKTFFELLTSRERWRLYFLFGAVLVMAGLEVVSVGAIMPFLQVAADPSTVHENTQLRWAYETFEFTSTDGFLIGLGLVALFALLVSNSFIVLTTWLLYRYAWRRNHSLSTRLLNSYLSSSYEYFITRNSSELSKNILDEVKAIVSGMLIPGLKGGAKSVISMFIIGFLVFVDPWVAFLTTLVLGSSYIGIYYVVKNKLKKYGDKKVEKNTQRYEFVNQAFGGIKQVKLLRKEGEFLSQYIGPSREYSKYQARFRVIKQAPRYALEAVAFGGIILIAVYLIAVRDDIRQVIPMLGLYAFAGYRLMPALQQAFKGFASVRFNIAALEKIHGGLMNHSASVQDKCLTSESLGKSANLQLNNCLVVSDVHYTYPGAEKPVIDSMTFKISAGETVGFVGKTGSGKTTTVNVLMGLLRPQKGHIFVDDTPITDGNIHRWQQNIGYVPQEIYLSDDSVARNIAFGVPRERIDMDAVKDATRRASIYDFVESLPNRWQTVVGERGVKLSGGQRQRIGIARALYHNPSVLVFDEATSALDQATEAKVMESIYDLEENHTLLVIAHRLSTVQRADKIIMLEGGEKVAEGKYEELKRQSSKFRIMAQS